MLRGSVEGLGDLHRSYSLYFLDNAVEREQGFAGRRRLVKLPPVGGADLVDQIPACRSPQITTEVGRLIVLRHWVGVTALSRAGARALEEQPVSSGFIPSTPTWFRQLREHRVR